MNKAVTALAFDYGLHNIGVAYGQSLTGTAGPLQTLKAKNGVPRWEDIQKLIGEWQPLLLVVGLPLNMDGSDSEFCRRARRFSRQLHGRFALPVEMMDERLSSFAVKQQARSQGYSGNYRDKPLDSLAAQIILEDWFRQED
ncbi:MAG: putative Holliday junction resolvase [Cellvibrionaceae bacterium]|jgi:putative Holliday junction resolvase